MDNWLILLPFLALAALVIFAIYVSRQGEANMKRTISINGDMTGRNISIQGHSFNAKSINVSNNRVYVDGVDVTDTLGKITNNTLRVEVTGTLASLKADGSVVCQDVDGNVEAGGSVKCRDVNGNVNSGGSAKASKVNGSMNAGGSIKVS